MRKVVADTWACPSAGRALGPGWRTCWLAPRRARRALGASGCRTRGQGARRGHGRAWLRVGGAGSRLTMAELLRSLRDSQLVARFQRRCGLFPAPEVSPREKGRGPLGVDDGGVGGSPRSLISPITRVWCLPWEGGLRLPAYLRLRLRVTPRWGLEGSVRRHPASTLGRVRRGTVIRCHPLSLQVAVSLVFSDTTQRLCMHPWKDFLLYLL